jgi:CRISPR-associated protein Cmr4
MITRAFLLHALSPLHAGTGQALGVIDLPVARLKGTGIPYLPGSSIKGVLRDAAGAGASDAFGSEPGEADETKQHAGALAIGDARLLLLPVRSLRGTFAWVTSPLLLRLAARDMQITGVPALSHGTIAVSDGTALTHSGKVFLEEIDFTVTGTPVTALAKSLAAALFGVDPAADGDRKDFQARFAVVDDESMTYLMETATQVDAHNRIDKDTGVVAEGQLWYEESLPAESVLVGVVAASDSRVKGSAKKDHELLDDHFKSSRFLQFGGKGTVGRGRTKLIPLGVTQ